MFLRFLAVSFLILLISASLDFSSAPADSQITCAYPCVSSIPLAWSQFKGGNQQSGLAFQDCAGTFAS